MKIVLLQTAITVVIIFAIKLATNYSIGRTINKKLLNRSRGQMIRKTINIILLVVLAGTLIILWGVDQSEILLFLTSVLTVIGVALFAQWSLLSNLTSGVILFFNHSVKLNDTITIMDKDYEIEGEIVEIGFFFVTLKTAKQEQITMPSNVFLQKTIKKKL